MIVLPMAVGLSLAHFARRSEPAATVDNAAASRSNEWLAHLSGSALAHFLLQLLVVLLAAKGAGWLFAPDSLDALGLISQLGVLMLPAQS